MGPGGGRAPSQTPAGAPRRPGPGGSGAGRRQGTGHRSIHPEGCTVGASEQDDPMFSNTPPVPVFRGNPNRTAAAVRWPGRGHPLRSPAGEGLMTASRGRPEPGGDHQIPIRRLPSSWGRAEMMNFFLHVFPTLLFVL